MNDNSAGDRYREACPSCGTEMDRYVPTAWHCPKCDREYWKEGDSWWSCDVSGEPKLVETATDGSGEIPLAGLREAVKNSTPKGMDWCPRCEEYRPFKQLQVVERPEFGVRNVVKGCPGCRYSCINQTEWVEVGSREVGAE